MKRGRTGIWFLIPQAVSRLESIYIFALVAHHVSAGQLGALALGTAFTSASLAFAPAVVGKPLAAIADVHTRTDRASLAQSAAVYSSLAVGLAFIPPALATHGLLQLAFLGGMLGVPGVMVVESYYWRSVFVSGPKFAGLSLSLAYGLQAVVVTLASPFLGPAALVVFSFAGIGFPAVLLILQTRDLTPRKARLWVTSFRDTWLPYVVGVAASVVLVQAIPTVLSATAGFASASTYRAGEIAFGGTNLLISVSLQRLLTQGTDRPRAAYARSSINLAIVAAVNGVAIRLVPRHVLEAVIGPTTPLLLNVLALMTIQRAALAASSIGGTLLIPLLSARMVGIFEVTAAIVSVALLVGGALVNGLDGAIAGLAISEVILALVCARRVYKATAHRPRARHRATR